MPIEQVIAIKNSERWHAEYEATLSSGMLPIARANTFPSLIHRWGMEHVRAPAPLYIKHSPTKPNIEWRQHIWVEAWVVALIYMSNLSPKSVFINAWTSVQENKLKILELKIAYNEAVKNPESRLVVLTALQMVFMSKVWTIPDSTQVALALDACIRKTQREVELKEP